MIGQQQQIQLHNNHGNNKNNNNNNDDDDGGDNDNKDCWANRDCCLFFCLKIKKNRKMKQNKTEKDVTFHHHCIYEKTHKKSIYFFWTRVFVSIFIFIFFLLIDHLVGFFLFVLCVCVCIQLKLIMIICFQTTQNKPNKEKKRTVISNGRKKKF